MVTSFQVLLNLLFINYPTTGCCVMVRKPWAPCIQSDWIL